MRHPVSTCHSRAAAPRVPPRGKPVRWVPVPEEAFQAALKVRVQVQKQIHMRPDLSIVIAGMLSHAAESPAAADAVARHALALLTKSTATLLPTGDDAAAE